MNKPEPVKCLAQHSSFFLLNLNLVSLMYLFCGLVFTLPGVCCIVYNYVCNCICLSATLREDGYCRLS